MILFTVLLYCWLRNLSWWGGWPEYRKEAPVIVVIFLLLYFSMRQISIASLRSLFSFSKGSYVASVLHLMSLWWHPWVCKQTLIHNVMMLSEMFIAQSAVPSSWATVVLLSPVFEQHSVLLFLRPAHRDDHPAHNEGRRRQRSAADIRGGRLCRTLHRTIRPWTVLYPGFLPEMPKYHCWCQFSGE